MALSLEQRKIDCLIIEAGLEKYSDESQESYKAKIIGDQITDLRYSRLRQLGGTSGHWGGWCKPIEQWNVEKWGIEFSSFSDLKDQTCKILDIENNFQQSKISNFYSQIQFQYSKVRFADKYKKIRKENFLQWKDIMIEDLKIIEGMQEGRNSPIYNGGNFSPVLDNPTHHFAKWVTNMLIK